VRVAVGAQATRNTAGLETAFSARIVDGQVHPGLQLAPFVSVGVAHAALRALNERDALLTSTVFGCKLPIYHPDHSRFL